MNLSLDYSSLKMITRESNQVMVYGWQYCDYINVIDILKEDNPVIKKVFDCWLGNWRPRNKEHKITTLEGRLIEQITYHSMIGNYHCPRMCKAAIVNLILENCKRKHEGLPLIPLLFCFDIDGNSYPSNSKSISTRDENVNKRVTNKELRRCYKLCFLQDPELKEVSQVALETIKFVKLTSQFAQKEEYKFVQLQPFWEKDDWNIHWQERQSSKKLPHEKQTKTFLWVEELKTRWLTYLKNVN